MFSDKTPANILVVRLGAMGDVIHALPAVATLKSSFPLARVTWVVDAPWVPLLRNNPNIDSVIPFQRKKPRTWFKTARQLREKRFSLAIDFQGLLKSALIARAANPSRVIGFAGSESRERAASFFYSQTIEAGLVHAVERNLALAKAAGAENLRREFPIPAGSPEGDLPRNGFVLASPLAGWISKQWPLEYYAELARHLDVPLVLNGPPQCRALLESVPGTVTHISGIDGLIDATRRATAVIGVDSGPMHLAAALNKPGVAIFGPTDPARNGPYGNSLQLLCDTSAKPKLQRSDGRSGAYIRGSEIDSAMRAVTPAQVLATMKQLVVSLA